MGKINFQSPLFPQKSKKNRTIARNLGQIVLIGNRTIARTVLIESVLLEDPLYLETIEKIPVLLITVGN